MGQTTPTDETETNRVPIEVGLDVSSYSPTLYVPADVVDDAEQGDYQQVMERVATWWDSLDVDERAAALSLSEKDGSELVENILFIDRVDEDGHNHPIAEW